MKQRRNDRWNKEAATGSFLFLLEFRRMRLEPVIVSIDFFFFSLSELRIQIDVIFMLFIHYFFACFYLFYAFVEGESVIERLPFNWKKEKWNYFTDSLRKCLNIISEGNLSKNSDYCGCR